MKLFIVRHGETNWNREGRFQGQMDIPLNEKGLEQARMTAERFRGYPLEAVYASPLSRANVTGQMIARAAGCPVIDDRRFMEINHGAWEGTTTAEVENNYGDLLRQWKSEPHLVTMPGPGGESLADVQRRTVAGVEEIIGRHRGDLLLSTHDAAAKTVICHYLGMPLSFYWRLKIPNCSVSYIEFLPSGPQVALLGDVSHFHQGFDTFISKSL